MRSGEDRIRTCGPVLPGRFISNEVLSTTQPPLPMLLAFCPKNRLETRPTDLRHSVFWHDQNTKLEIWGLGVLGIEFNPREGGLELHQMNQKHPRSILS